MTRNANSATRLTFDQKLAIIRALWPLGDRTHEFLDAMKAAEFAAFAVREQWIESFAQNGKEIDDHREYVREWAKYALGSGMSDNEAYAIARVSGMPDADAIRYRELGVPPGLQRLKEIRDKKNDGVPEDELYKRFSPGECYWRAQIDQCRRRIDESIYFAAVDGLVAKEREAILAESASHATDLSRHYSMWAIIIRDRFAFSRAVLARELAPRGFHLDRKRSRIHSPVFTRAITPDWEPCFELVPYRIVLDAVRGWFDLRLVLRRKSDRSPFDPRVHLEICYFAILQSLWVYSAFSSMAELETVILARTFLYGLMGPAIEEALRDRLEREFATSS